MHAPIAHKHINIWLLAVIIAMTPWLSFWATPVLGEQVTICTLQGIQVVTVDKQGNQLEQPEATPHCPALQLLEAYGQSVVPTLPKLPDTAPKALPKLLATPYQYTVPHLSVYIGRAPPAA